MSDLNFKVWFEFLDGTALVATIPCWLRGSQQLYTIRPGTIEEVCLQYSKVTKTGVPVYRERPVGRVLRFPVERVRKSGNNVRTLPNFTVERP
jgi:hypothetical protein